MIIALATQGKNNKHNNPGCRGWGGSLALAKLQIPALVLARYPSFVPNVNPECKLLTAYYVGRFYKATCVTPCILEVGVRTNSQYNQSHRVLVFS